MTTRAWGNEFRDITVSINSYQDGVLSGCFFNPYLDSGRCFNSLTQFLLEVEQALDAMDFPRSFNKMRRFSEHSLPNPSCEKAEFGKGKLATFSIRIIFRQNSSWQGLLRWWEWGEERSFRSVLELIMLMDDALNKTSNQQVS